jgi:predicted dehydrogenase
MPNADCQMPNECFLHSAFGNRQSAFPLVIVVAFADVHREVGDDHPADGTFDFHRAFVAELVEFPEAATAATAALVASTAMTTTAAATATTVSTTAAASTTMATAAVSSSATAAAAMTSMSAVSGLWHILLTQRFSPDDSRAMATRTLQVLAFTRAELQRHTVFPCIRCNNAFPSTFTPEPPAATVAYGYFTAQLFWRHLMTPVTTRRTFLAGTAGALATGLVVSAGDTFAQNTDQGKTAAGEKKLGWAIMGIGRLTTGQIMPAFLAAQKSKPVAFITGHPVKAKVYQAQHQIADSSVYSYENTSAIKDNPAIDVVYNVLPNGLHMEYTIKAFEAGKHVLCEKPMANTSAECQKMIDAGKAAGKKLMIAYRCQYEPHTLKAIELCRSGDLGKLKLITSEHGFNIRPNQWRLDKKLAGGGPMMDIGIYALNACRYLTGEEPIEVTAQITLNPSDPRFKEVEESLAWTMTFPSGALGICSTSYSGGGNHARVLFDRGILDMEPATSYTGIKIRKRGPGDGDYVPVEIADINEFATEMDYFSDCVMNDKPVKTAGEEGRRDIKIIEACYESARTGKAVKIGV